MGQLLVSTLPAFEGDPGRLPAAPAGYTARGRCPGKKPDTIWAGRIFCIRGPYGDRWVSCVCAPFPPLKVIRGGFRPPRLVFGVAVCKGLQVLSHCTPRGRGCWRGIAGGGVRTQAADPGPEQKTSCLPIGRVDRGVQETWPPSAWIEKRLASCAVRHARARSSACRPGSVHHKSNRFLTNRKPQSARRKPIRCCRAARRTVRSETPKCRAASLVVHNCMAASYCPPPDNR